MRPIISGFLCGVLALYAAIVGILVLMQGRTIIADTISLGQCFLLALGFLAGLKSRSSGDSRSVRSDIVFGATAGAIFGGVLTGLLVLLQATAWRSVLVALSPELRQMLSFGLAVVPASAVLVSAGAGSGVAGALWPRLDARFRSVIVTAAGSIVVVGALQQLLQVIFQRFAFTIAIRDLFFTWGGLTITGAIAVGAVAVTTRILVPVVSRLCAYQYPTLSGLIGHHRQKLQLGLLILGLALLPALAGSYIGQVLLMVGLYTLMGMGLNIEVGLAGLLDLGFVAFFAVGAYTTALLTADSPLALSAYTFIPTLSFWEAAPLAVLLSVIVGVLFGLPVLGVRGDYLAIATLGLGEIVRVVVLSDLAAPFLGGAQGVLQIPKPKLGSIELSDPVALFYLTLASAMLAAFIAWRLQYSRLGRAWMALRDDEDVAQALGIHLVKSKLLAYGLGAAFAGLAGAIFATMLTSVYPNSFTLLVSINVLALIVIGGVGSVQGVLVGAVLLVGLPELLREFGEYRLLFYGAALIAIMILRPKGLWGIDRLGSAGIGSKATT